MSDSNEKSAVHAPVLCKELLQLLAPRKRDAEFVDATIGEGGHSILFLSKFPSLRIFGVDADSRILHRAEQRLAPFKSRVTLHNQWFDDFFAQCRESGKTFDGILMDLGVSMYHFSSQHYGRGFSFRDDTALDMRLSGEGESAADIVNTRSEEYICDMLLRYGEERRAKHIATAIVTARKKNAITSSQQLMHIVLSTLRCSRAYANGVLARVFQAIRIVVNDELERVKRALPLAFLSLRDENSVMGVISFHSLEDRIVKHMFRDIASGNMVHIEGKATINIGKARILQKKPITAPYQEVKENYASRTAKLRIIEKLRS